MADTILVFGGFVIALVLGFWIGRMARYAPPLWPDDDGDDPL